MEADVYPRDHPERADLIDGAIGELSHFHQTHGYYAHGVGPETATLPEGWEQRLVPVPAEGAVGLCLELHDLVLSKYVAGREKDREFVRAAIEHRMVRQEVLASRIELMPLAADVRGRLRAFVDRDFQ